MVLALRLSTTEFLCPNKWMSIKANQTLLNIIDEWSIKKSNQIATTFLNENQEQKLSYSELEQKARTIAVALQNLGMSSERVLLLYPPGLDYITAFLGCLYAKTIAVPVYPPEPNRINRTLPRLQTIVANAEAKVILTTSEVLKSLSTHLVNFELDKLEWLTTDSLTCKPSDWVDPFITPDTIAYILYTSGSTGTPKGVVIDHSNILHNVASINKMLRHNDDSVHVSWLPLFHDFGLVVGLLEPLYGGYLSASMSPIAFLQRPYRWLETISRYRGTTAGGPNFAFDLCTKKISNSEKESLDLSSWKAAINGAEPVKRETLERFISAFSSCGFRAKTFNPSYGMTQATASITFTSLDDDPFYYYIDKEALKENKVVELDANDKRSVCFVSCGYSLPDQKMIIVDPKTLTECKENEVGEIWLSGPSIGRGYWKLPEETSSLFNAFLANTDGVAFLRTEDLGFIKNNELFITGRIKDIIIIRGVNHYPQDIENTVEKSHVAIRLGCSSAFSIEIDNQPCLIVVAEAERRYKKQDSSPQNMYTRAQGNEQIEINAFSPELDKPIDLKEVIGNVRQSVAEHHDLRVHKVVLIKAGTIFKTSSGKIQRHACREAFLEQKLDILEMG